MCSAHGKKVISRQSKHSFTVVTDSYGIQQANYKIHDTSSPSLLIDYLTASLSLVSSRLSFRRAWCVLLALALLLLPESALSNPPWILHSIHPSLKLGPPSFAMCSIVQIIFIRT
jgi:hypothetical protein